MSAPSEIGSEEFGKILQRAQDGDRQAMDKVLQNLRPYLASLARPYADPIRPAGSTADLLQDACLRAWRKLGTFEGGKNDEETFAMFRSWIGQIVRRLGLNSIRDRAAKGRIPSDKIVPLRPADGDSSGAGSDRDVPARTRTPSAYAREGEMAERIRSALESLADPTAATVVRLRFFDGMTIPEIAERLDMSPSQVRERHRSAMRRLRRELGEWL
ncbi:MAG: sigma-70 family RNA polymerase sigma factor [Planctomycetota bacterium]|nr:sigma-70 family RNA polymerase sigma factor [Planctomycetota bacterium]